ncbi:MAG: hypothetical protein NC038_08570 [Paludibacter sp.]|nr:hypothetical protein [Bacteroidales bacterium]MCM1069989.1 hypothetical protein [Prevotella sp.]MCM1354733.1 hypothetical protein [Bacteroides sp.]MCM1443593.1 hypothetical protein [Muribaculum sp.]MCM1482668.1 hypothetical protein [Paludibacter sp.]
MKTFLKYLGAILVLCGVLCLAYYFFYTQTNALLVAGIITEFVGLVAFVMINKRIDE